MRDKRDRSRLRRVLIASLAAVLAMCLDPPHGQVQASPTITFPQVAAGPFAVGGVAGDFSTSLLLINGAGVTANIDVEFRNPGGEPVSLSVNNQVRSNLSGVIPAHGVLALEVGSNTGLQVAAARVTSDSPLHAQVLYRFTLEDGTIRAEAGVEMPALTDNFITYVDTRDGFSTGIAVANSGTEPAGLEFSLVGDDGARVGDTVSVTVPPFQQIAKEVTDSGFTNAPPGFVGTLQATVAGGVQVAVTAIRFGPALQVLSSLPVLSRPPTDLSAISRGGWDDRYFTYEGEFQYFTGFDLQQLACDRGIDFRAKLDFLASFDLNKVRIWIICSFLGDVDTALFPYPRVNGKFDLDRWDTQYWARLRDMIAYAKSKGIIVEASIFEVLGPMRYFASTSTRPYPYNRRYNIQNFGRPNSAGTFKPEFYDLYYLEGGRSLQTIQKNLIDKTISELSSLDNVYFELMNEYPGRRNMVENAGVFAWGQVMAAYMKSRTNKPVTVHSHGTVIQIPPSEFERTSAFFWDKPYVDGLNFHFYDFDPHSVAAKLHGHQLKGKMLINNEGDEYYDIDRSPGYPNFVITPNREKLNQEMRAAWAHVTSGSYYLMYHGPVPQFGGPISAEAAKAAQAMRKIVETVRFWNMKPVRPSDGSSYQDLVTQGPVASDNWRVMADEGASYLVYFWGSPASQEARIDLAAGTYGYHWYDVREWKAPLLSGTVSGGTIVEVPSPPLTSWDPGAGVVLVISAGCGSFRTN